MVLKFDGNLISMMPAFKKVKEDFWVYLDHSLPLNDPSMLEAVKLASFAANEISPRSLQYTNKHRQYQPSLIFLRIYLMRRWLRSIFGNQMLITVKLDTVDVR